MAFYILLSRFGVIWAALRTFFGFFMPLILGCVIAFVVNPLANRFYRLFPDVQKEKRRRFLANLLAFIVVLLFLAFAMIILIPQLIESAQIFAGNLDSYAASLSALLRNWGLSQTALDLDDFISSSENLLGNISASVGDNLASILSLSASIGKILLRWVIAFILAVYLLAAKPKLKAGLHRLLRALFNEEHYDDVSLFLQRCDRILNRYIIFNLLDSLIIGVINAIFMTICGMQYVGLVSFVVAVTNLVPTFGPIVGTAIGGFVLLMVHPVHALIFLIFSLLLQLCDGYILKPRLFSDSLGVSSLWILIGVVVSANMFGVVGILLAIPGVAILDLLYNSYLLPHLEAKRRAAAAQKAAAAGESGAADAAPDGPATPE